MNTIFVLDRLDRQSLTDTWTKNSISRYIVLSEHASSGAHRRTRMCPYTSCTVPVASNVLLMMRRISRKSLVPPSLL